MTHIYNSTDITGAPDFRKVRKGIALKSEFVVLMIAFSVYVDDNTPVNLFKGIRKE